MVLKTLSLRCCYDKNREFNGKVLLAEQVTDSYLSGLNALGGLYAKLESSEKYIN
jgi:hypothetical protein